MKKQLETVEAENKRLMDHMVRHSKAAASGQSSRMAREGGGGGRIMTEGDTTSEGDERPPMHGNRKFIKNVALTGSIGPTG